MNLLDANKAALKLYGYTRDELTGLKATDISAEASRTQEVIQKDFPAVVPIRYHKKKDGTVFPVEITASYFQLDGRKINIAAIRDIGDRIKAEQEKERLEAQLRQSRKMESIGNLAGGIAHDFNNILTSVIGFTELAIDDVEKNSAVQDHLQEIYTAGERAKDLIKQILTFARQFEEEAKPIRVDIITKEVLKLIRASLPTSIAIDQDIESQSLIMGNATQVHQVLMNLCTNAADAMTDKIGTMRISLKDLKIGSNSAIPKFRFGLKPGNYIELTVSDTGYGIPSDHIESIFEPYFTTKDPGKGTGMGLAVTHGIVESCGGKIAVDSTLGQGSVFTAYFPTTKMQEVPHRYESEQLPSGTERILFVDDERAITKMSRQVLQRQGYSVTAFNSSLEALELFRSTPNEFDLVITDMTMPGITGDHLAAELMAIRPDIPVILSTGYSKKLSDAAAGQIGTKAFSYKPIVKADLLKTVREVLDRV